MFARAPTKSNGGRRARERTHEVSSHPRGTSVQVWGIGDGAQQQSNENGTISISIKTITKMTSKIFSRTSHFVSLQRPTMQRITAEFFSSYFVYGCSRFVFALPLFARFCYSASFSVVQFRSNDASKSFSI